MLMTAKLKFAKDAKANLNKEGVLTCDICISRYGIFDYKGSSLGLDDAERRDKMYKIYRAPDVVMDKASVASFAGLTITNDHPPESITTDNAHKYQVGLTGNDILRDGEFLVVRGCKITDEKTINDIIEGKVEVSCGHYNKTTMEAGITDDGDEYDGKQEHIFGNHLSLVPQGRAGSQCRILLDKMDNGAELWTFADADDIKPDNPKGGGVNKPRNPVPKKGNKTMNTRTLDIGGVSVTIANDGADSVQSAVNTMKATHTTALDALKTEHQTALDSAAETHKTELQKAKDERDALKKLTEPAVLDAAVEIRTDIMKVADAMDMTLATDGCDNAALMGQIIDKHYDEKDHSKGWSLDRKVGAFQAIAGNVIKDAGDGLRAKGSGGGNAYQIALDAGDKGLYTGGVGGADKGEDK